MRIVQTFWTAGQDPLKHSFGWLHPEYNLMSWALSCLSLREHYDEVALYTDSRGKEVLINLLHLPYTEVNVVYDDFKCLPQHWALAKVKTYSLQTKPFLHIDGDVYLPKPIGPSILGAPLIAQNREIGTGYYRRMMNRILSYPEITMPAYIEKGLKEQSIASYNMGIFGGQDLCFIQRYCDEVFHFMESNQMNDPSSRQSAVDCNVFFEQVILAVMADGENKCVASVLGRPMRDEGYTGREFCDLMHFCQRPFFHVVGGHKRNQGICDMIERTLLGKDSGLYLDIIRMFPDRNQRLLQKGTHVTHTYISAERCIAIYEDFIDAVEKEWHDIPIDNIYDMEIRSSQRIDVMSILMNEGDSYSISINPYLRVFAFPHEWNEQATEILRRKLRVKTGMNRFEIAVIPTLTGRGIKEVPIGDMAHNILALVREGCSSVQSILDRLNTCFNENVMDEYKKVVLIADELDYLSFHGIINFKTKRNEYRK